MFIACKRSSQHYVDKRRMFRKQAHITLSRPLPSELQHANFASYAGSLWLHMAVALGSKRIRFAYKRHFILWP